MSSFLQNILEYEKSPCPPWACITIDNIFRKALHNPYKLLGGYIKRGDTVMDIGPGKGFFTIPLAELVGPEGMVHAFDIQKEMLDGIMKRAEKHNLSDRIMVHLVKPEDTFYPVKADFALAFWMLHEVSDANKTACQIFKMLRKNGLFFVAEPLVHVPETKYNVTEKIIINSGFVIVCKPAVALSRATLFRKQSLSGKLWKKLFVNN